MKLRFIIFITAAVYAEARRLAKDNEEKKRVFSNMQHELKAAKDLAIAIETVTEAIDATSPQESATGRALSPTVKKKEKEVKRKSDKKTPNINPEQNPNCERGQDIPEFLWIQTGEECRLDRKGRSKYQLISDVGDNTFMFTDRPARFETVVSTDSFVDDFNKIFESSDPNVGVTLVSKDTDEFLDPLVVIASNPMMTDDGKVSYEIEQSDSQDVVNSLESYFEQGVDSASFKDCSLFIDGSSIVCTICSTVAAALLFTGGGIGCTLACAGVVITVGLPFGGPLDPAVDTVAAACAPICGAIGSLSDIVLGAGSAIAATAACVAEELCDA